MKKPEILLMDFETDVAKGLSSSGFNVSEGTFGTPYFNRNQSLINGIIPNFNFPPNYSEKEIIFINLDNSTKPVTIRDYRHEDFKLTTTTYHKSIDPRLWGMIAARRSFNRILEHKGIFVIFADQRKEYKCQPIDIPGHEQETFSISNWSFLNIFDIDGFQILPDATGKELQIETEDKQLKNVFKRYTQNVSFNYQLNLSYPFDLNCSTLLKNKYDQVISIEKKFAQNELVYIFPQFENKKQFILDFIKEFLSERTPSLFPELQGAKWVHDPDYEHSKIIELNHSIEEISKESENKINEIKAEIREIYSSNKYLHDLLTETGDSLVKAVKTTLEVLGFKNVIDSDNELKKDSKKLEDLQIQDKSPLLLIEVKGISTTPSDEDWLAVEKYIAPRMKEYKRTDIEGLSIINFQKQFPPLERDNKNAIRDVILDNAENNDTGLMSSWDLFKIARSYIQNSWKHEYIQNIFYQNGKINCVPNHYEIIGKIEKIWKENSSIGVILSGVALSKNDRLAFDLENEFVECNIESLQVNDFPIEAAKMGESVGIKINLKLEKLKKGTSVFKIKD